MKPCKFSIIKKCPFLLLGALALDQEATCTNSDQEAQPTRVYNLRPSSEEAIATLRELGVTHLDANHPMMSSLLAAPLREEVDLTSMRLPVYDQSILGSGTSIFPPRDG